MNKALLTVVATSAAFLASMPALAATTVVDVSAYDAKTVGNVPAPVTQIFGPGTYDVSVVGKAGGGIYDAWSVATPAAANWDERYTISYGKTTTQVNPYNGQRFATAADALAAFSKVLTSFTLSEATAVTFSIPDYATSFWDNTGGVSLGINSPAAVPEPGTIGLFGLGGLMLFAMLRRKKAALSL